MFHFKPRVRGFRTTITSQRLPIIAGTVVKSNFNNVLKPGVQRKYIIFLIFEFVYKRLEPPFSFCFSDDPPTFINFLITLYTSSVPKKHCLNNCPLIDSRAVNDLANSAMSDRVVHAALAANSGCPVSDPQDRTHAMSFLQC